jgi:UDP-glucose:(heptosyl)LPS alpha-1,3-glucosyltransferase
MKIALIVHDLRDYGGHSRYTKVLANELSERHEVTVFANTAERPENARWQSQHVSAWRRNALAGVQTFPWGIRTMASKLANFDIRHMQGYCGGAPNVVTAHICVAAYLESLQSIRIRNRVSLRLMAAAEGRFYRRYHGRVIAISEKISRELREYYQFRGAITVIPHGVDAGRFNKPQSEQDRLATRAELGISDRQTTALYVGDLIKAHVHLKALTESTPQVQFIIVSGSTLYRWDAPNVRFVSSTTRPERYYAAADAFVFPTSYDAFGMVLLEAMASGLPVFTSDCAGAAELITHGDDGYVLRLDEWVAGTREALLNAELGSIGRKAKQTASQHDWVRVARSVEQTYRDVLQLA